MENFEYLGHSVAIICKPDSLHTYTWVALIDDDFLEPAEEDLSYSTAEAACSAGTKVAMFYLETMQHAMELDTPDVSAHELAIQAYTQQGRNLDFSLHTF